MWQNLAPSFNSSGLLPDDGRSGTARTATERIVPVRYSQGQAMDAFELKLTVVYYHERDSVLIDHDDMTKLIQDALAGLVYNKDRQITDFADTQDQY
jgi:Holliday junction resolvase RusA-like endonuclease